MREIFAAEVVIASGGVNFDNRRSVFQNGHIKGSAPQIENQRTAVLLRMQAISHCRRRGFIDQTHGV
ncbi:NAD-specific glutamate dehydrogenase [Salmonella enterica subsp. enterica serovar Bovismorbificans]|uniref:NAD-specific glutamate dehydrogenase n=1 Tax=Salmonella enterica subsp. enterica serovar Bovismorbificans TaxID=58097 RepID=A0A655BKQ0_SALET|nr:NAD-specific glutamate dehydrogenase [Salmonella enterica subsp. enterica serovar Bovismorbificans]CPR55250.1 NAD-specific glutamate dehydrogenase [Salmonella enterica subsp. enterica serovar Bovismorbificans]